MDLSERLTQAASAAGILAAALPDAISRGERHFTLPPTDRELADWAVSLKVSAPHFFPAAPAHVPDADGVPPGVPASVWKSMSASSKLAWARQVQPPPVVQRRPKPLQVSAEQAAALAQMTPAARLTAYRQLQADES
jgi:hypothetical protein